MKHRSIHDNVLTGYEVDCARQRIVFHTELHDHDPKECTDIVFSGVEAYHFIGDNMQTILRDVAQVTLEQIMREFAKEFQDGMKYCWPGPWNDSQATCLKHFHGRATTGWVISSAYGGGGFVIAKTMEIKKACGGQQPPT